MAQARSEGNIISMADGYIEPKQFNMALPPPRDTMPFAIVGIKMINPWGGIYN